MTVTLTQSTAAAFPDRPGPIGTPTGRGLAVDVAPGEGGACVELPLAEPAAALRTRVMLHATQITGGRVVIVEAHAASGEWVARLVVAPAGAGQAVYAEAGDGTATSSAGLDATVGWHAVELAIAADGGPGDGEIQLWVDGRSRATRAGLTLRPVTTVRLGAPCRDATAAGSMHLDEWLTMAGGDDGGNPPELPAPIGPVIVPPGSEHAVDPTRWLVIYNADDAQSVQWAMHYRAARGVPLANLLGLALASAETIDAAAFEAMAASIRDYLAETGLDEQVIGLVFGHAVPGYYIDGAGALQSIADRLHAIGGDELHVETLNPLAAGGAGDVEELPPRPTLEHLGGVRLTARMDGPTLAHSIALVDRATAIATAPLGADAGGTIWLDAATPGVGYEAMVARMIDWATGRAGRSLRLPLMMTEAGDGSVDPGFEAIADDAVYIGWRAAEPGAGFFAEPAGRRAVSVCLTEAPATATTVRDATSGNWITAPLAAGYAAAAATCRVAHRGAVPLVDRLMNALAAGWTLGEAWFASLSWLGAGMHLVGDPLMTVAMPREGWQLAAGAGRIASVRRHEPIDIAPHTARGFDVPVDCQPTDGQTRVLVVESTDAAGQPDGAAAHVRLQRIGEAFVQPPADPAWPSHEHWRPVARGSELHFTAVWPQRFADAGLSEARLVRDNAGATEMIDAQSLAADDHAVTFTIEVPPDAMPVRYRIEAVGGNGGNAETGDGGGVTATPWSAPVGSPASADVTPFKQM